MCHLPGQDTSRGLSVSQVHTASKVCAMRAEGSRSLVSPLGPWGACGSQDDRLVERSMSYVLASHSHHKTSLLWTLAQDIVLEWELRKKSFVGGGAPCESR